MAALTVVCLNTGTKYSDEYVLRLQAGVARWLSIPHEFICLTMREIDGVRCVPFKPRLRDWWGKVAMFEPGVLLGEKLYLDLDVIATGPLDDFVRRDEPDKVWALDDFSYSLRRPKRDMDPATRSLLGGYGTCNSSVLYWNGEVGAQVWTHFHRGTMDRLHGDQNHITQALWPHTLALYPPELACSYKYHVLLEGRAHGSLVVFHGEPKPHQLEPGEPLRNTWESQ